MSNEELAKKYQADVERATEAFQKLLLEQLAREERMEAGAAKGNKEGGKIIIGVIDGDGIGPILLAEARRILEKLLADEIAAGKIELRNIDGLTIENRLNLGVSVPPATLAAIKECDVLLKGPTTTPKGGTLESANVTLRRELDLYANVRPVSVPGDRKSVG